MPTKVKYVRDMKNDGDIIVKYSKIETFYYFERAEIGVKRSLEKAECGRPGHHRPLSAGPPSSR